MTSRPGDIDDMRRLGLGSGASLADAKDAWRRAASRLHPDRAGPKAGGDLAEVNAAYQRLQAFHERFGRFPDTSDHLAPSAPGTDRRFGRRTALILALGIAVFVLWPQSPADTPAALDATQQEELDADPGRPSTVASDANGAFNTQRQATEIALGMTMREVARIAGEPLFRSPERWDYGPSEVRFEKGKVSGWHVSPLRPLPVQKDPHN